MNRKLAAFAAVMMITTSLTLPAHAEQASAQASAQASSGAVTALDAKNQNADKSVAAISKEKAVETAVKFIKGYCDAVFDEKKYVSRADLTPVYNYLSGNADGQKMIWNINYNLNGAESNSSYYISIEADSGEVRSFSRSDYNYTDKAQIKVASVTQEEAQKTAEDFISRVAPDKSGQIERDAHYNNYTYRGYSQPRYTFRYIRKANGIRYDGNAIIVGVDGRSGKVTDYSSGWDDTLVFPSGETSMDKAKAQELLQKASDPELMYIPVGDKQNYGQPEQTKLVYRMQFKSGNLIDAQSGSLINPSRISAESTKTKDLTEDEKKQFIGKWKESTERSSELDSSQTAEIAKTYAAELFGEGYTQSYISYQSSSANPGEQARNSWNVQFSGKSSAPYQELSANMRIDAVTGQIMYASNYALEQPDNTEFTPVLTWEEAYVRAVDLISRYYPDKVKDINTKQSYTKYVEYNNDKKIPERQYYFNFYRQANGVPYIYNSISISFDLKTGTVMQMSCNWNNKLEFTSPQNAISAQDAVKAYFQAFSPELVYTLVNIGSDPGKPQPEIKLVYTLGHGSYYYYGGIDAFTGKWTDMSGEISDETIKKFEQSIKDKKGEKEASLLAYQGLIDIKTFNPDAQVTRMELIRLLVNIKEYSPYMLTGSDDLKFTDVRKGNEDYSYLQLAVKYGIIDNREIEFKGNEAVSREEAAEMLVREMGYATLARAQGIFTLSFSDKAEISSDKFGYVAIGVGLGIIDGSGEFKPKEKVPAMDMVMTVYKSLSGIKTP